MLNRQVLVLNKYWVAVHVCTARRAVGLVFQELARIVTEDFQTYDFESWRELSAYARQADPIIHTPTFQMMLPQVIVLSHYHHYPPRTVRFNRRNIFLRDEYTCQYCGCKPRKGELSIDHVIPISRGGKTDWGNVVLACTRCNTLKGNRLSEECGMFPSKLPRKPSWIASFQPTMDDGDHTLWQKFIDTAYWDSTLHQS